MAEQFHMFSTFDVTVIQFNGPFIKMPHQNSILLAKLDEGDDNIQEKYYACKISPVLCVVVDKNHKWSCVYR